MSKQRAVDNQFKPHKFSPDAMAECIRFLSASDNPNLSAAAKHAGVNRDTIRKRIAASRRNPDKWTVVLPTGDRAPFHVAWRMATMPDLPEDAPDKTNTQLARVPNPITRICDDAEIPGPRGHAHTLEILDGDRPDIAREKLQAQNPHVKLQHNGFREWDTEGRSEGLGSGPTEKTAIREGATVFVKGEACQKICGPVLRPWERNLHYVDPRTAALRALAQRPLPPWLR
ncbi:MAG TPA: hypothetical protein VNZ53_04195 [Steroidobacteraceae bacterium]|jgi:hypothetical protein|nr:hypothetical protein [Steroidobacteraceae bacterium]